MKGLASLIAALGAGMGGYAKGNQIFEENERTKRAEARADEQYQFDKRQREKTEQMDADLAASQQDVAPEVVKPDVGYNIENTGGVGAPATAEPAGYRVEGQTYATPKAAQAALNGVNSQSAKLGRAADVMAKHGQIDKATLYHNLATQAISEGTDKALAAISATAPKVEDLKKAGGTIAGTVGEEAADVFNKTGGRWKLTPDTVVQHFIDKDAAGREFVNSRVLSPDGRPLVSDVRAANRMLMDAKGRMEAEARDTAAYQTGLQIFESGRHNKAVEDENARSNKVKESLDQKTLALRGREVAASEGRLQLDKDNFKRLTPEGQIERIEQAVGAKFSPEEKKKYLTTMYGMTKGKAVDDTFINDVTKEWAKNNPQATATDVANFRMGFAKSLTGVVNNEKVKEALDAEFSKSKPGTQAYAFTWNEAKSQLRMTDDQLKAMGYTPPPVSKAQQAASTVGTQPDAPEQGDGAIRMDVRGDPALAALNAALAKLDPNDPRNTDQLMKLGTARNARIQQLQAGQGSNVQLITQ